MPIDNQQAEESQKIKLDTAAAKNLTDLLVGITLLRLTKSARAKKLPVAPPRPS